MKSQRPDYTFHNNNQAYAYPGYYPGLLNNPDNPLPGREDPNVENFFQHLNVDGYSEAPQQTNDIYFREQFQSHSISEEDLSEGSGYKNKKRKATQTKSQPKKSILEDLLELLDDGKHGIRWCVKLDTEGDEQDGMQIYNESILEQSLQERRKVKGYGLSKHLAKDLRYYGFVYDKEKKTFWNEDSKDHETLKSFWQKNERSNCLQLRRITSEPERNLTRLTTLTTNIELAEILKAPEIASKVCPPPNKYINLNEISCIFTGTSEHDIKNIKLLLSHTTINKTIVTMMSQGFVRTSDFDRLYSRIGGPSSEFITHLREFVSGAQYWYHGFIESFEATELLRNKKDGTYLIRESTRSDCYSLSWITTAEDTNQQKVNHMRITQSNAGFKVNTDKEPSRTLKIWISNHSAYLKYPLPSTKFRKLIIDEEYNGGVNEPVEMDLPKDYVAGFPG